MGIKRSLVFGMGINDSDKPIREVQEEYSRWVHIMNRCYGPLSKGRNPKPVVDERWLKFSNFLEWLYAQPDWRDYELHKGIKEEDNVTYSPEKCVMVHPSIRRAFSVRQRNKHGIPHGVSTITRALKVGQRPYCAQSRTLDGRQTIFLGLFWTPEEAHRAWQVDKVEHLIECLTLARGNVWVIRRIEQAIDRIRADIKLNKITEWCK